MDIRFDDKAFSFVLITVYYKLPLGTPVRDMITALLSKLITDYWICVNDENAPIICILKDTAVFFAGGRNVTA